MTEPKQRDKYSASKIQKYCCKNKLLLLVSQYCILQTSLTFTVMVLFISFAEELDVTRKSLAGEAHTQALLLLYSPGHCCNYKHRCLCSPPRSGPTGSAT